MQLDKHDLVYLAPFVLLDEATRASSGKRQTRQMKGFWGARQGDNGMRGSDKRLRRTAMIHAFREIEGISIDKAASEVGTILGMQTVASVNVIRADYYQHRKRASLDFFPYHFFIWREWVFESSEETLEFFLGIYGREFGQVRRRRLSEVIEKMRRDPEQKARNRTWLLEPGRPKRTRIESNHWDPERDWRFLATDLWMLGRLHARIGERAEAKALLKRALDIWKASGHQLPHVQAEAIPALKREISYLSRRCGSVGDGGRQRYCL